MGRPKKTLGDDATTGRIVRIRTTKMQDVQLTDYCDLHGVAVEDVLKRAIDYYLYWLKKSGKYIPRPHAQDENINLALYKIKFRQTEGRELSPDEEGGYMDFLRRGVNPHYEGL